MLRIRHLLVFYLLTFLLLALVPLSSLVFNNGSMDFSSAANQATASTGIKWTSNILNVVRLSTAEPILLLTLLGSSVPALAALLVLAFQRNGDLWRRFALRFLPWQRGGSRAAALSYLGIFTLLIPALILVYFIRTSLGASYESNFSVGTALLVSILMAAFLDQGALLEELGWRGYAQLELQRNLLNPLQAAIIVGLAWGLWHLPRDITTGVIERLGFASYLFQFLPSFVLGTVSVSIIATYFSNKVGGSVIPAIFVHGITNDSIGISGMASITEALTPFHQITKNAPFALIALGLVVFFGAQLGKSAAQHEGS